METRANYTLIGLFTLAIVAGVFGFVYWFQNLGGHTERSYYRVVFTGSVGGLRTGGTVLFNGLRVGEVAQLKLDSQRPDQVTALIAVDKGVAIRDDTQVGIEFQGLTGIAAIGLTGGTPSKPPLAGTKENPATIPGNRALTQDLTSGAREVLARLDGFIAENQTVVAAAVKNIEAFTETLARNSDRIDHILIGLESLAGGNDGKSGEINEAARSVRTLADNLDKRSEEVFVGINRFTASATKQFDTIGASARSTLSQIEKAAKSIGDNPSSLLFGGSKQR
jgi:phospholipid/cholesterol/gamma-HCH transport system substrate-binding protein